MSAAMELFGAVVRHAAGVSVSPWLPTSWSEARGRSGNASDEMEVIHAREVSSSTDETGMVTAVIAAVGPRIEPKIERTWRPVMAGRSSSETIELTPVGPDGPVLKADGFELHSWNVRLSGSHPLRWSVTVTGRN